MSLGAHLRTRLLADGVVQGLIGDKIFPGINRIEVIPPMVIYQTASTEPTEDLSGEMGESFSTVQFNCFGDSYDKAVDIKTAIFRNLQNYSGLSHGVRIKEIRREGDFDADWDEDDQTFRRILVLRVTHTDR